MIGRRNGTAQLVTGRFLLILFPPHTDADLDPDIARPLPTLTSAPISTPRPPAVADPRRLLCGARAGGHRSSRRAAEAPFIHGPSYMGDACAPYRVRGMKPHKVRGTLPPIYIPCVLGAFSAEDRGMMRGSSSDSDPETRRLSRRSGGRRRGVLGVYLLVNGLTAPTPTLTSTSSLASFTLAHAAYLHPTAPRGRRRNDTRLHRARTTSRARAQALPTMLLAFTPPSRGNETASLARALRRTCVEALEGGGVSLPAQRVAAAAVMRGNAARTVSVSTCACGVGTKAARRSGCGRVFSPLVRSRTGTPRALMGAALLTSLNSSSHYLHEGVSSCKPRRYPNSLPLVE
ncbi:hypothetical protein B0H11DRAFT_322853 [Mycena galericulata]|nr:hypothetical protein B0H11DRAFT_322853 [Mycena galericulata]